MVRGCMRIEEGCMHQLLLVKLLLQMWGIEKLESARILKNGLGMNLFAH